MVKATLLKNDYMVKIDRKDAYQCIPVHTQDRAFMRFQWVVQLYQYAALPFGLASAPRQFTKIMKPIVSLLRRVGVRLLICLNDNYLQPMPKPTASRHEFPRFLLRNLGLVANVRQLGMSPMTLIVYLAMTIDRAHMHLSPPDDTVKVSLTRRHALVLSPMVSG